MNATARALAPTDSLPQAVPAPRQSADAGAVAFDPVELQSTQDDDLRLERASEAIRVACRTGSLEQAAAAAAAAMPTLDFQPARSSLLALLARTVPVPMAPPDENRLYLLRRLNGAPVSLLRLRDNGRISASGGPNGASTLSHWTLVDGQIELLHADGRAASRLPLAGLHDGLRQYLGESQLDGALHLLSEVRCTYSRLRMLDPEIAGPFGALYDSEAMVPVPLPERPVVLLATPHTGAQRLLRLLNSHPQTLIDGELLHPRHIGLYGAELRAEDAGALYAVRAKDPVYFSRVLTARSHHLDGRGLADVPVRGFTLNPAHAGAVFDWAMNEPAVCIVHLVRDNLLAEYASIVSESGDGSRGVVLAFEPERFERFVTMKQNYLAMVQRRLDARRGAWAEIETGALTADNITELQAFLSPGSTPAALPAASLTRPRGERTIERFANPDDVMRALAAIGREDWAEQ